MMITISRWNDANGSRSGQIRITMPVGDRTAAGAADARGNRSRLTAITARVRPGAGVSELLGEVAPQTRYAKSNPGPQVDLASRVLAAAPLPVIVKRLFLGAVLRVGGPLFCDTSLVSNLGVVEPPQFGPHTATEIWFSTSAHMPRGLSLGVVTVDGALRLTFRYRRALLSDAGADEFAGLYMAALSLLTGEEART
jgi:NRPS condensation-like uncharacterized protein